MVSNIFHLKNDVKSMSHHKSSLGKIVKLKKLNITRTNFDRSSFSKVRLFISHKNWWTKDFVVRSLEKKWQILTALILLVSKDI